MSMRDNPGCGYVLPVTDLITALPQPDQAKATELLDNHDFEALQELLSQYLPSPLPRPAEIFVLGDDDSSDDLEQGITYARFDEGDLYIKVERPAIQALLQAIGQKPEFSQWTVWG